MPVGPVGEANISENIASTSTLNNNPELNQTTNDELGSAETLAQATTDETPIPVISSPKVYIRYEAPKIPIYDYSILRYFAYLLAFIIFLALASYKLVLLSPLHC